MPQVFYNLRKPTEGTLETDDTVHSRVVSFAKKQRIKEKSSL